MVRVLIALHFQFGLHWAHNNGTLLASFLYWTFTYIISSTV